MNSTVAPETGDFTPRLTGSASIGFIIMTGIACNDRGIIPGSGSVEMTHVKISMPDAEIAFQCHGTHDHRCQ